MYDFSLPDLEAVLQLDYLEHASLLEQLCAPRLKPAPDGIYVRHQFEPVVTADKPCYQRDAATGQLVQVTSLEGYREALLDERGKVVIPKATMLKKDKMLSNQPFLPYRGGKILELLVKRRITEFVAYSSLVRYDALNPLQVYSNRTNWKAHIAEHFDWSLDSSEMEDYLWDIERLDEWLEDIFTPLCRRLNLFLGNYSWNIFHVKLTSSTLRVDRCMDWRAYEWTKRFHEEADCDLQGRPRRLVD